MDGEAKAENDDRSIEGERWRWMEKTNGRGINYI